MNLNDLNTFVRVAETGSITAAARELEVPKSTVSRRVVRLEDELGLALLRRTGREVHLTEAGERLHARSAPSLLTLRDLRQELADATDEPGGTLRITAPHDMGANLWFSELLTSFRRRYPNVMVSVQLTHRVLDLVAEGLDLAIRPGQVLSSSDSSSLVSRRLAVLRGQLYASRGYIDSRGFPATPDELREHDCLAHSAAHGRSWSLERRDGATIEVELPFVIVANDFNLLTNAVVEGAGIGFLPLFGAQPLVESGELVPILPEWRMGESSVWLVWPSTRHLSPRVRAFVDYALTQVPELEAATE